METAYYTVGVITNTHGLRGEVRVWPRTDFPERRFTKGSRLWLRKPDQSPERALVVRSGRPHKNQWVVAFQGLPTIQEVEPFKGMELCVPEAELMPLPEGTYYIHELLGMDVVTDDGRTVGKLVEVLQPGANDVYVVRGNLQEKDVLVPAIPECILQVNVSERRMTVHLLPGLLEADEE
ncbi:MAG: ribosome maturation factor RimM [Alicyclobacillus sp.]|nr:ribosome maturation factor RimM [Alicyclobacillus sp.]